MKAKLQTEKDEQTKNNNNKKQKVSKAKKHFQKLKYKPLLTSTETEKNNNQHKHLFTTALPTSVKRINTQESYYSNFNCRTNQNSETYLIKKTISNKILIKNGVNNKTPIMLSKNVENKKKRKQVSIDLQNRYYNIVHKNYMDNSKKEKEKNDNSNSNIKKNLMLKSSDSKKSSIIIKDKNQSDKIKSIKVNKFINKEREKEKEIKNKNIIRKKSLYESNKKTFDKKIIEKEKKENENSEILDSIYTFKTLLNINEKQQRKISSPEQMAELKELKLKLNFIKNMKTHNSNILHTATSSSTKFNIISADMLDCENDNFSIFNIKEKENNIEEINNEIIISSNQRIQTYKILLDCINNKFKEIEELVEKEDSISNNNYNHNKMSELHSNIEFSQDDFSKNSQTTIINLDDKNECSCDIFDEEMKEKSNIIIPSGNVNQNLNDNINKDFELLTKSMTNKIDSLEQNSIHSELLLKNLNDCENTELVSFISNGMFSLFQNNNNIQSNQSIIDIKNQKNNNNLSNTKCNIF